MKGLPCTCCQCGVHLSSCEEGRRPLELFCDCLVALCTDCGYGQLEQHFGTGRPFIECPVCGSKETNDKNGYVERYAVAVRRVRELQKGRPVTKRIGGRPWCRSAIGSKATVTKELARQYVEFGFNQDMQQMRLPQLELFIARCAAFLLTKRHPPAGAPLPWGPLQEVHLKKNLVLERVLGLLESGDGMLAELPSFCQLCDADLVPGNTVRGGRCSCCLQYCQLCTRRATTALKEGTKCLCCRKLIPVLERCEPRAGAKLALAKTYQDELVRRLVAEQTGTDDKTTGKRSKTLDRSFKYALCWDLKDQTSLPSDFFVDQEGEQDRFLALDEGVLNLGLARVQADLLRRAELQRQADAQGTSTLASPSDYLPLGPVGRLAIRRDHFL
ncbi:hypothetical protein B484DRAFT_400351, partial [Ochromonadaceae sp. CCMP2298]